jgi:uncharacterized iron-regulated membrane protein
MTDASQTPAELGTPPPQHFYRAVWRWHFYAGIFVVPFMVVLSVTGIIYLFKPQLDGLMYHHLLTVTPQAQTHPASAQLATVQRAYPDSRVASFRPAKTEKASAELNVITADGRSLLVYVNPYDLSILGTLDSKKNLQTIAIKLHGELLIPPIGDWIVELAACWALVLLVSGLYLWFPRTGSRIWGVLLPRLRGNGRPFWRDVHAVSGFYGALVIGFMILTGLPWAVFWGTSFANISNQYPDQRWVNYPKSTIPTGALNTSVEKTVPWATEQTPMPQSAHVHGTDESAHGPSTQVANPGISVDTILGIAKDQKISSGFTVFLPEDSRGVYTISAPTTDPKQQAVLHVDQYSGQVITDIRWRDYGIVAKTVELGITVHQGTYFGIFNQLLMLFAALVVLLLAVSGTIMWWRRRPAKVLGAPPMPANFPLWKTAVAIIFVMGILFPLVGISLIFVLLFDYLVLSRIPRLRQVLG